MIKEFGIKLIDVMIGVILGLGFQWWTNLQVPWQYIAFIFIYLATIDYWIDTAAALRKYPPKHELDLMIDIAVLFSLFLLIYSTQATINYFLISFIVFRILDSIWSLRVKREYLPERRYLLIINTWIFFNLIEIFGAISLLIAFTFFHLLSSLTTILIFVGFKIFIRILSSLKYKKVYF